jgi:hypothetical protein
MKETIIVSSAESPRSPGHYHTPHAEKTKTGRLLICENDPCKDKDYYS